MNNNQILYLSRADMDEVGPTLTQIVDLLHTGFDMKGRGRTVLPAKHWLERGENRFYSAMSSYIPDLGYGGCKWQSGDPLNSTRGLPYIQGLYVLTEDELGIPVALMDSEWITGRRTAAASALAVRLLANPGSETLAILGCGLQGRTHLAAIKGVMPDLKTVKVFDIRMDVARQFAADLAPVYGVEIIVADNPKSAVSGCAVVISGGPIETPPRPVIEADWLDDGAVGVTIDYDSYWTANAMESMATIVTDDKGQIDHLKEFGLFTSLPKLDGELSDIIVGNLPGRKSSSEKLLCFNLGIAIEDLVTAKFIYDSAVKHGKGTYLDR